MWSFSSGAVATIALWNNNNKLLLLLFALWKSALMLDGRKNGFCAVYKVNVNYTDIALRSAHCHTTMGIQMPYGITQCFPGAFTQPKLVLDLAPQAGCKAELT